MSSAERLASERNVWLATTRPDGRPHLTPIWFVYVRDKFWIATGAEAVKTRNVANNDRVSVSLEDGNEPVVAEGRVVMHPDERPADVVAAFEAKFGWDIKQLSDPDVGTVVLYEINITKWLMGAPSAD